MLWEWRHKCRSIYHGNKCGLVMTAHEAGALGSGEIRKGRWGWDLKGSRYLWTRWKGEAITLTFNVRQILLHLCPWFAECLLVYNHFHIHHITLMLCVREGQALLALHVIENTRFRAITWHTHWTDHRSRSPAISPVSSILSFWWPIPSSLMTSTEICQTPLWAPSL